MCVLAVLLDSLEFQILSYYLFLLMFNKQHICDLNLKIGIEKYRQSYNLLKWSLFCVFRGQFFGVMICAFTPSSYALPTILLF